MPEQPVQNLAQSILPSVNHNPDVLSCLANLSNDEVFTPPSVANAMLDMLPQELFSSPKTKFLDPVCKSGIFLREITKRLMKGLEREIPDLQKRLDHILHNQIYGSAITELTSLLSRRTLYCTKYPNGYFSISHFDNITGNIRYKSILHTWKNGKCIFCGASQEQYGRGEGLETHAYEFIHVNNPQEIFGDMKFDVIIGNPPYQLSDGGGGAGKSSSPLYQKFIIQAEKLNPNFLIMIIPSRWYAGGKGLDEFRTLMLNDSKISKLVDFIDSKICFGNSVDIPGGICYFLRTNTNHDKCAVININKQGEECHTLRKLNDYPIFIRDNLTLKIVKKITNSEHEFLNKIVLSRKPFGLSSDFKSQAKGEIFVKSSKGLGLIKRNSISNGLSLIDKYKIIISKVSFEHAGVPDKNGMMRVFSVLEILPPGYICTESYLVINSYETLEKANNLLNYLKTKFVRFLVTPMLSSMNMSKNSFCFVPLQDFSKSWTDTELYKKYNLSQEEIDFIESMIKPMDLSTDDEADNA